MISKIHFREKTRAHFIAEILVFLYLFLRAVLKSALSSDNSDIIFTCSIMGYRKAQMQ